MSFLSRCQDLIGSLASTHSTFNLIGSCKKHPNIQSYKNTKLQRYKATKIHTLTPLTYELFFQNSSSITLQTKPTKRGNTDYRCFRKIRSIEFAPKPTRNQREASLQSKLSVLRCNDRLRQQELHHL